jgi:hypothetical protein
MGRRQCDECGARYEVSPEVPGTPQRCGYCGALLEKKRTTLFGLQRPRDGGKRGPGVILAVVAGFIVVGVVVAVLLMQRPSAPPPSSPPPVVPPVAETTPPPVPRPAAPPPPPTSRPPRERTVHDDIREFFVKVDGRLCIAGNLSRFGPFAGSVQLTAHPEGRVSQLRIAMQPEAPKVTRCLQQAFSRGPVYRGRPVGVVYHFGGGRSADGLQYHDGVELKGSAN